MNMAIIEVKKWVNGYWRNNLRQNPKKPRKWVRGYYRTVKIER